jgi:hypothetical protein
MDEIRLDEIRLQRVDLQLIGLVSAMSRVRWGMSRAKRGVERQLIGRKMPRSTKACPDGGRKMPRSPKAYPSTSETNI